VSDVVVTDDRHAAADRLAAGLGVSGSDVLESPHLLIGTIDEMVETLQRRREVFGISYYVVVEGNMEKLAPVVSQLAGQ